ncbi:hypothetical protein S40293_10026 [Stachybotrys chartarum IBT 40293]|nr:hypothetical protein S40293_10026 [Stachybotrys chartarum IBT 40293]
MDSICDACLAIDFDKALNHPVDMLSQFPRCELDSDATRFILSPSPNCLLCRLLSTTVFEVDDSIMSDPRIKTEIYPYILNAQSFLGDCPWVSKDVQDAQDCCILLALGGLGITASSSSSFREGKSGYVACLPKRRKGGLFMPEMIFETFDLAKAKTWLRSCKENHGSSCNQHLDPIPMMKVIDCQNLTIRPAQPGIAWIALSYVWGHAHASLDHYGSTLPPVLAKTVQDAIQVTKDLGYRYLWIDRYCIDQVSTDEADQKAKALQISLMDQIYHGADLTIVAAAGDNANFGLPGVGTTKRKKQQVVELERCTILSTGPDPVYETKQSSWASRGWTFQEASLSRRRLIFTEHQSWFECGQASWMESLGGLEHTTITEQAQVSPMKVLGPSCYRLLLTIPERPSAAVFSPSDPEISTCLDQFFRVVEEYSKRQLAFDNDALNAIAGICGHFQKSRPQVSYLLGIPYVPSPSDAGLEEKPSSIWSSDDESEDESDDEKEDQEENGCEDEEANSQTSKTSSANRPVSPGTVSEAKESTHQEKEPVTPDPLDWTHWTVGKHWLWDRSQPPDCDPPTFIERLESGTWSCFLLCDYSGNGGFSRRRCLMVLEWLDGGLARRVGSVILNCQYYIDEWDWFDHKDFSWQTIRLV